MTIHCQLRVFALLLTAKCALAQSFLATDSLIYDVRPRPRQLKWAEIEDEAKISFDGNVAAIQALALEKAAALAEPSNKHDDLELALPDTCDGTWTRNVHALSFQYMVEYDDSFSDHKPEESERYLQSTQLDEILTEIEIEVQNKLAGTLLVCNADRNEIKEANIVGLLARTPRDEKREKRKWSYSNGSLRHAHISSFIPLNRELCITTGGTGSRLFQRERAFDAFPWREGKRRHGNISCPMERQKYD